MSRIPGGAEQLAQLPLDPGATVHQSGNPGLAVPPPPQPQPPLALRPQDRRGSPRDGPGHQLHQLPAPVSGLQHPPHPGGHCGSHRLLWRRPQHLFWSHGPRHYDHLPGLHGPHHGVADQVQVS